MEQVDDLVLALAVEVAGRLVGQEQAGVVGERSRDGDALALADGELAGPVAAPVGEADLVDRVARLARVRSRGGQGPSNIGIWMFSSAVSVGIR